MYAITHVVVPNERRKANIVKLTEREIEAAKQHPKSRARSNVVDNALRALCVLECIRQDAFVDSVSEADLHALLYDVKLAMEVFDAPQA